VDVRQQAGDGAARDWCQLGLDQRSDLGLRLRDGEVEREGRHLVGGALLAEQLVSDLRPVAVREHDLALDDERPDRRACLAQGLQLLRGRPPLPGPDQRVAAERDDEGHATPMSRPRTAR
jgi:hypothetical protein